MKKLVWLPALLAMCCLAGCDGCKNSCNNTITAVLPNSNPVGYEILIKTDGFTDAAKVVFGSVAAETRAGGESGELIAKVPAGLAGNVEISLEEGDCIARSGDFVVSGALPTDAQPSLPDIVVPLPPTDIPTGSITNAWVNAARGNTSQSIFLQGTLVSGFVQLETDSKELDNDPFFKDNPISGTINTNTNVVYLEIDRSAKIGGTVEHFDGKFIAPPSFLPSNATFTILLLSRETGRQLLIYFPG